MIPDELTLFRSKKFQFCKYQLITNSLANRVENPNIFSNCIGHVISVLDHAKPVTCLEINGWLNFLTSISNFDTVNFQQNTSCSFDLINLLVFCPPKLIGK